MFVFQDFRLFGEYGYKFILKIRKELYIDYLIVLSFCFGWKIRVIFVFSFWESYVSLKIDNGECEMFVVFDFNWCF